jgi:hypothetical protein
MKYSIELKTMFKIPEGHEPVALIIGGTEEEKFTRQFDDKIEDSALKDMDVHSSQAGLATHPVMVVVIKGENGHLHSIMNLPLQNWQSGMVVEDAIEDSKDIRRVTDWVAGFMHAFCANETISAIDLTTGDKLIEGADMDSVVKSVRPKREIRLDSIGSVEDILAGQITKEEAKQIPVVDESPEEVEVPIIDVEAEKQEKMRREQAEIVEKFGWDALKEMSKRMNFPIVIKKK